MPVCLESHKKILPLSTYSENSNVPSVGGQSNRQVEYRVFKPSAKNSSKVSQAGHQQILNIAPSNSLNFRFPIFSVRQASFLSSFFFFPNRTAEPSYVFAQCSRVNIPPSISIIYASTLSLSFSRYPHSASPGLDFSNCLDLISFPAVYSADHRTNSGDMSEGENVTTEMRVMTQKHKRMSDGDSATKPPSPVISFSTFGESGFSASKCDVCFGVCVRLHGIFLFGFQQFTV